MLAKANCHLRKRSAWGTCTSHCQKSLHPPAGYLHLFYSSSSQRLFQELIGVPESLSGGLLAQNYFYNNNRVWVALIHNNTRMSLVVILIRECRVEIWEASWYWWGFHDSSVGKESACNTGDPGSIPGSGRFAGEGIGYSLQYSGLENSMDCVVHGVTKSRTWLSDLKKKDIDVTTDWRQTHMWEFSGLLWSQSLNRFSKL